MPCLSVFNNVNSLPHHLAPLSPPQGETLLRTAPGCSLVLNFPFLLPQPQVHQTQAYLRVAHGYNNNLTWPIGGKYNKCMAIMTQLPALSCSKIPWFSNRSKSGSKISYYLTCPPSPVSVGVEVWVMHNHVLLGRWNL